MPAPGRAGGHCDPPRRAWGALAKASCQKFLKLWRGWLARQNNLFSSNHFGDANEMASGPAWIPCPDCEEFYCTIHQMHAYECPCPPIEQWLVDPYTSQPENLSPLTKPAT